jgi:hypothetical protein
MIFNRRVDYFNTLENLSGSTIDKSILDFGGNRGNLLHFSQGKILEKNYTCIDIDEDSVRAGKEEFPRATWIHWNRYHSHYNAAGAKEKFPIENQKWDIIWSHSVFTHLDQQETLFCLDNLLGLGNEIYFSFIGTENNTRIQKLIDLDQIKIDSSDIKNINQSQYSVILDRNRVVCENTDLSKFNYKKIWTFYSVEYFVDFLRENLKHHNRTIVHKERRAWNWIVIK